MEDFLSLGGEANETQTFVDDMRVAQPYGPTANNTPARSRFSPFLYNGVSFSTRDYRANMGKHYLVYCPYILVPNPFKIKQTYH
ncbi:MAG: hypothetical protein IPG79_16080 [Saprospiraceae bacterium]|nr:hypothetical protein [Saprospiraceae bacterium]